METSTREEGTATVLVVDDHEDIREMLYDRLEFMDYHVLTARNGVEGLERIENDRPDLVLLDIQMPELDGFGVLKGIADKALDTTVIMITANGTIQRAVQAMQQGAFDFMLKPFQPRDVERKGNRALEQVRLKRENERLQLELAEAQQQLIERLQGELKAAHDMQLDLLPESAPVLEGAELAGVCIPAREVAGDYYTFLEGIGGDPGRLGIVLADVSGKGMQAATVALRFSEMLRYEATGRDSPEAILEGLDSALKGRIPPEMFATCGIGTLDVNRRTLTYCTAASPEVYHFQAGPGTVAPLELCGFPLGLPIEIEGVGMFQNVEVPLGTGDVMVFTSDGVEEAQDSTGAFYGEDRLKALVLACGQAQLSAAAIRDRVVADVTGFVGDAPQTDDLTVVVLRMT